jgi:hypothetical protein
MTNSEQRGRLEELQSIGPQFQATVSGSLRESASNSCLAPTDKEKGAYRENRCQDSTASNSEARIGDYGKSSKECQKSAAGLSERKTVKEKSQGNGEGNSSDA